jgi:hypothetical protein
MKAKQIVWLLALSMMSSCALFSWAQTNLRFKAGDAVEAHSWAWGGSTGWGKATVKEVDSSGQHIGPYMVEFEGNHATQWLSEQEVRSRAGQTGGGTSVAGTGSTFHQGSRVDVYLSDGKEGKNRGTVIAVGDGKYKVHYDGCKAHWDEWVDRSQVRGAASVSTSAPEIKYLVGSWRMFTPSYPTTVVHGNTVYREYGTGAKAPPLRINANGTYVWYFSYGKPPVKGKWSTHAKIAGARTGTETVNGILIHDPTGALWKVYKEKSLVDKQDRVTIRLMCSGETMTGTRIR